ncbi:uncharacterized protein C8R40DRAFT_1174040 [Lentinula edodes]|uniref:uncharacterized protein n=1 Tax=Lentinula edodes TaxID=5353 RepID=UPI001E8D2209|nr:uncharacterized protein C8R40DRAFT_1174040 [Lentinula edodes]KAH7871967.1 hypothetical protein C8R40DRAFT_1174040 [Lentinula edodes]
MRLKAIDDAGPGADVPVTIFSLGTKRKFMATPNAYPDLVRLVRRKFNIPDDCVPIFRSRAPTSNRSEERFEIDDSAYEHMKDYIDELEIVIEVGAVSRAREETSLEHGGDVKGKMKAKDTPVVSPSSSRETIKPKSTSFNGPPTTIDSSRPLSTSSSSGKPKSIPVPPSPSTRTDPHDLFNDDMPVEYASPKKKKTTKPQETPNTILRHVHNVDADEDEVPATPQPAGSKSKSAHSNSKGSSSEWEELALQSKSSQEEGNTLGESSKGQKLSHKGAASKIDGEISATVKKEKLAKPSNSTAPAKDTRLLARIDAITDSQPPIILTQDTNASAQSQNQSQTQTQTSTSAEPEPRFKIRIWGPRDQNGEFMTKKKHTVRKVLAGACKNFGLDPIQAKLQLVVELPDEFTGEMVSHHYDCDNEDTVGKAGIGPESTLKVCVLGDEEEEDYEEGGSY